MIRDLFQRGDRIGEYEILGRLRAGGMATLFLGRRHGVAGVSRRVVIKVIHPHLAEDELIVKMFIDEARICSSISHPNVVYIEKLDEVGGTYYLVMEYVDGCSIDQVLRAYVRRTEPVPIELAARVAIEAAGGLHAAHETRGDDGALLDIVHRDVSPSNILISRDGAVKVIDFGIAKARNRLGETRSGASFKGKLRYMSPEQAFGRTLDRRSDIYSLAIVLWEMLAGRQMFRSGDDLAVLEHVRQPSIDDIRSINPDVPHALAAVVHRALAPDPANRHESANEFRRELVQSLPGALRVEAAHLARVVETVQSTLGVSPAELEARPPTPQDYDVVVDTNTHADVELSSVRAAAGEVGTRPGRARAVLGWAAAGCALAAIVTAVVVATRTPSSAPLAPSPAAAAASPFAPPPVPPPPSTATTTPSTTGSSTATTTPSTAGTSTAGTSTAGTSTAGTTTAGTSTSGASVATKPAPAKRATGKAVAGKPMGGKPMGGKPMAGNPTTANSGIHVDGVLLADEPSPAAAGKKPKKRPAAPVKVDGTVLAP